MTSGDDAADSERRFVSRAPENHCTRVWQSICGFTNQEAGHPESLMHWSVGHFLSDRFPDLGHPAYQSALEKVGFILVTGMLLGSLLGAVAMVIYEL